MFVVIVDFRRGDALEDFSNHRTSFETVTSSLVPLHVASDAESLSASLMRALEGLLTGM